MKFLAWVIRLRAHLWRFGGKLKLDAPWGAELDGFPVIKVFPDGDGSATTTVKLGKDVRLGRDMTLELHGRGTNVLEVGDEARLTRAVWIVARSGSVRIGDRATIRDGAWLKSDGDLSVGDDFLMGPGASIHCAKSVQIGAQTALTEHVSVLDSDHSPDGTAKHWRAQPLKIEPVSIGRNVLISAGAVILRGTDIGDNSVVGANSVVVRGKYESSSLLVGSPARVAKSLLDEPVD